MLLTLDHWTKIDSTAALPSAAAARLFHSSFFSSLLQLPSLLHTHFFINTFSFRLLIRESFFHFHSPGYSLLQQITCPTVHTPFGTCVLSRLLLFLLHHWLLLSPCLSNGQSTIRLAPPAAAARRPDRFPCRMFHETSTGEIDLPQRDSTHNFLVPTLSGSGSPPRFQQHYEPAILQGDHLSSELVLPSDNVRIFLRLRTPL